jgi:hypothetical protein
MQLLLFLKCDSKYTVLTFIEKSSDALTRVFEVNLALQAAVIV